MSYESYDDNNQEYDYSAVGYYDEEGNWHEYEKDNLHDEEGRLINTGFVDDSNEPEDPVVFVSKWREQRQASKKDAYLSSLCVWPNIKRIVNLKRLDIYESDNPVCQQATTNLTDSRRIRKLPIWFPVRSVFLMDELIEFTKEIETYSTGPPRRDKFIIKGKKNVRDLSTWVPKEVLIAYQGAERMPGVADFSIDFQDTPDRYFISSDEVPALGRRRLYRFGAYSATQYFILESRIHHECLEAEGGSGLTHMITCGSSVYCKKHWKLIGSFFGFDYQLPGSNLYTIYTRQDPFPRMMIALGNFDRPEEWNYDMKFYAFDVAVPGTVVYQLQHCIRSIYSTAANVPRHRLTTDDAILPWEFRMNIYVFPAILDDCRLTDQQS